MSKPFSVFGFACGIGIFLFFLGIILIAFVFFYWLITSKTSPFTSLITVAASLLVLGLLSFSFGFLTDLIDRNTECLEEILSLIKKKW